MAHSTFRVGLELEMHGIRLTFRRRNDNALWPVPPGETAINSTMMATDNILEPVDVGDGFFKGPPALPNTVKWESNWGFRAVGDAFSLDTIAGHQAAYCVLELASAARPIDDYNYWKASRKSAQAFVAATRHFSGNAVPVDPTQIQDGALRWFPLQTFLAYYNGLVQALALGGGFVPGRFKLAKSAQLVALEGATHPSYLGQNWDAFVCFPTATAFCSVQVNYDIGLRALYNRIPLWTAAWSSMWVTTTNDAGPLDPAVGDIRPVPLKDMYKAQTLAAMWRAAAEKVQDRFPNPGLGQELLRALVTYLVVCGSVNIPDDETFIKNNFPQLPKTSPASIRRAIEHLDPTLVPTFQALAVEGNADVKWLQQLSIGTLRSRPQMVGHPGYLPDAAPYANNPAAPKFSADSGALIGGPASPFFKYTCYGAFDAGPVRALNDANKHGFVVGCPFHVSWASGVNTSSAAVELPQVVAAPQPGLPDVKVLFESRYDRSMLNIGFDPYVQDFLFSRSYLSLVRVVLGQGPRDALQAQVGADFPDDGLTVQVFPNNQRH